MPLSGELWPAHPKPLPDELLSSWIVRIAHANGLKLQTFCDQVFGKERQLWNRDIDRSSPAWLLTSLARHTGTPIDAVRRTTLDVYRGRLYRRRHSAGQLRWILLVGVYHRTRRRFGVQFCPQCLADDGEPYFRTQWRVAVLTFCPLHQLCLHDRCPACAAPVAYHRRELGRPNVTDPGPLCLCHACGFDLRSAERTAFSPYDDAIGSQLGRIALHVAGQQSGLVAGHLDVLHQLCKVMVSLRKSANLATYAAQAIAAPMSHVPRGRQAFELRPCDERRHIIQLAAWVLAKAPARIAAAWQAKAVRYSDLTRDFPEAPSWYRALTAQLNRAGQTRRAALVPGTSGRRRTRHRRTPKPEMR
ncbi:MAG: TniQ family protein [Lysobacter sp.]